MYKLALALSLVLSYILNVASNMTDKLRCVRNFSAMGGQPNFQFPVTWLHAVPKALPRKLNTINQAYLLVFVCIEYQLL